MANGYSYRDLDRDPFGESDRPSAEPADFSRDCGLDDERERDLSGLSYSNTCINNGRSVYQSSFTRVRTIHKKLDQINSVI